MSLVPRLRTCALIVVASVWLSAAWVTLALAQVDEDGDGPDGDEFAGLPLVLGIAALALVGYLAYRRRSARQR